MAGYIKEKVYDWKIVANNEDGFRVAMKATAYQAYRVLNDLRIIHPNAQMYCEGTLVTK